ncbi:hypothetical protein OG455_41100 [Kitasatospora sp. NBC_01287]|uniref:hypothetical protein n=1 Tax=Kitasatospora sp. NBC_01287 TaxID=2903573 RepID=UPI002257FBBD|nr:hypothetical protein [Kitasatospora sp. NBC_01287]MCX4750880.1 hypothetical protein [Kitasatospora sp. NBC_01287]MCX4751839.1 hypothetical protein [Kitasatospora sp. NBC_01287]
MAEITTTPATCINCGSPDAPHRGEIRTTRVADGVVRDQRVHRCTPCQVQRYEPQELRDGQWAVRDRSDGTLTVHVADGRPLLYPDRATAQAWIDREHQLDQETSRGRR